MNKTRTKLDYFIVFESFPVDVYDHVTTWLSKPTITHTVYDIA